MENYINFDFPYLFTDIKTKIMLKYYLFNIIYVMSTKTTSMYIALGSHIRPHRPVDGLHPNFQRTKDVGSPFGGKYTNIYKYI